MTICARLIESHEKREYPIGATPLLVGRDPTSDVIVEGADISRRHAYVLRTPQGIVVVDTSTHGTFVNGDQVQAQRLLVRGDVIQIGERTFVFDDDGTRDRPGHGTTAGLPATSDHSTITPAILRPHGKLQAARALAARPSWKQKVTDWLRRYGAGEVVGLAGALTGSWLVYRATGSAIAAAYGASVGESLGFYGTIVVREMVLEAYAAGARRAPYGPRQIAATWRSLFLEFGPAEFADTLVLRPFMMWLGEEMFGRPLGILAGKLLADLSFYAPVILMYEVRKARARGAA